MGQSFLTGLYYVMPNLENFNIKGRVIHHLEVGGTEMALVLAYGLLYTTLLLVIAAVIFQRRDFR
jgi:ABC-type transport system involved in multi-copper enzyme maturation permease subunit